MIILACKLFVIIVTRCFGVDISMLESGQEATQANEIALRLYEESPWAMSGIILASESYYEAMCSSSPSLR